MSSRAHGRAPQSRARAAQWPTRRFPLDLFTGARARRAASATERAAVPAAAAAAANAAAAQTPRRPLSGADLVAWCREHGAAVHPAVELVYDAKDGSTTTTRTLRVSGAVRAGEHLCVVPARLCVGDTAPPPPPAQRALLRPLLDACPPDGRWQWRSAVALLHHALADGASASFLKEGYLPHLPGRAQGVPLPQVPLLWSPAELRELQGSCPRALAAPGGGEDAQDAAEKRRAFARDHLAAKGSSLREALGREARGAGEASPVDAGERLLAWALAVVTSRSFGLPLPSSGRLMVPLVDMANHLPREDPGRNAEVRAFSLAEGKAGEGEEEEQQQAAAPAPNDDDDDDGAGGGASMAVVLQAARDIAPGEAIAICYGDHGPADTLLSYGFVMPPPPSPAPSAPAPAATAAAAAATTAAAAIGPPCHTAWDPDLLLAAFEALVAGAGPGVTQARELPGWQRRALEALFAGDEAAAMFAGAAAAAAAADGGEAASPAASGSDRQEPPPSKRKKNGPGRGDSSGGFGAPGAKAAAERKAAPAAAAAAAAPAATVRLGGDPRHTVDTRLAGAARLLALTKQDPAVAAVVRALAEGGPAGLSALCAPMPGGGGGGEDRGGEGGGGGGGFPVSAAHEAVAARALSGYTALLYKRAFRTTIQEDERLLRAVREGEDKEAQEEAEAGAPLAVGRATARDRCERRELALRFRLSAKRELEKVAQALSGHMRRALEEA